MNWLLQKIKNNWNIYTITNEIEIHIKFFFFFLIISLIILLLYLFFSELNIFNQKFANNLLTEFKTILLSFIIIVSCFFFFIQLYVYLYWFNNYIIIENINSLKFIQPIKDEIHFSLFSTNNFIINFTSMSITKTSMIFSLLFCLLYPIIFFLLAYDYNEISYKFYIYILFIYFFSFVLIFTNNIIVFYFSYEIILILVFASMYLSSNSRGGIEAALFFLGWAILGSILVSLGVIIFVVLSDTYTFSEGINNKLSSSEIYTIYLLLFFGFGTKLSTWPFWYWLPRAHVEVSTGMSIFLSCILIKLSYYALLRFKLILNSEISYNICILVTLLCVIDITTRLLNLTDLKALVAYSSVVHTNILLLLVHLDSFRFLNTNILYIWGHSISTACIFISINLIESRYGTRNPLNLSGLYASSPLLSVVTLGSVIIFLDFPLTLFYWGEFYFWLTLFSNFTFISIQILFLMGILFISIFFKYWWNVLYGAPNYNTFKIADVNYFELLLIIFGLLLLMYLTGLSPSLLTVLTGNSIN